MTDILFDGSGIARDQAKRLLEDTLDGADDGELFFELSQSEGLVFDDGRLKSANYDTGQGFGLRCVAGETQGYAHSSELSKPALKRASDAVKAVRSGHGGSYADAPQRTNAQKYAADNPLEEPGFERKVALLEEIDSYVRARDAAVKQVSVSLAGEWRKIEIIRRDGWLGRDIRPLVRLNVSVVAERDGQMGNGSFGVGGREAFDRFIDPKAWREVADKAFDQAMINTRAIDAPAGTMDVVLGPGWPGVMLHEAVGHGLEGDFNRKKTSAFAGLIGERVASEGVTVIDDGTLDDRRGSLTIDDEGTPSACNVLIEDGILKGFMQDRLNARLMKVAATGNGRRQSYAHAPMPRMTNTFMRGGAHDPQEIISSVKQGLYAVSFGGGQVDITNGKFVFSCTEAYRIENGKLRAPVKGATLIGNGPDALTRVTMIGNDMELDTGIGTCGKAGQSVPVGVGQPTLRINALTVGGTAA
jgi:TldD protein